ncbi:MAG: hypothetical protein L3J83_02155 [Proteobacteria bacterium]|nr:hypothetical protein [Pseudomonadota bacterium]
MADPEDLIKGNCYFRVGYVDIELFIPVFGTYIFIETVDEDDKYWLFQDAESFASQSEDSGYLAIPEEQLYSMFDIKELRNNLKELVHLHPIVGNVPSKIIALTDKNRSIILKTVKGIIRRSDSTESLTITSNFRDKGLSLKYNDGGIDITMFLNCKEVPEEEKCVRDVFSELGILPITDYLAQNEIVRVLSYSVNRSNQNLVNIIGDIFLRAYKIRENEKIKSHYLLEVKTQSQV